MESNENDEPLQQDIKITKEKNEEIIFEKILSVIKENNSNLLNQYLESLSAKEKDEEKVKDEEKDDDEEKEKEQIKPKRKQTYQDKEEESFLQREKEIQDNNKYFNFKDILNRTIPSTAKSLLYTSIELNCFKDIILLLLKYGANPNQIITTSKEQQQDIYDEDQDDEIGNTSGSNNNNNNNRSTKIINPEYYKKSSKHEGPIHYVVRNGESTILSLLLDYNVNVDQKDSLSRTPIMLSSANGKTECSRLLVLKNCKVNYIDKNHKTALHLAIDGGYNDIATTLTQNGADISLRYHYKPINSTSPTKIDSKQQEYTDYKDVKILNKLDRFGNIQEGYDHSDQVQQNGTTQDDEIDNNTTTPIASVPRKYSRKSTLNSVLTSNINIVKNKKEIEKELERSIKWTKMIKKYNSNNDNKKFTGKFKTRSIKGIPDRMRSEVWPLLSHAEIEKKKNPGLFNRLVLQHSANEVYIDLDVNRAYRNHIFFRERYGMGQVSLFNVLKVYSLYDTGVGYTQGMSSIASLLVMYLSEEDAFWTLHSLMYRPEYNMRSMFLSGLPGLLKMSFVFENLLNHYFPIAKKSLDDIMLTTTLYSTKWFLIGFLDSFPFHISLRVWDLIFSEGYNVVYSIAMSLFRLNEKALIANKDSFEKCYSILRSFETFEIDEDIFIKYVMKYKISSRKIQFWENKYDQQHPATAATNN